MRILVVGAGSTGGYFGGRLAAAGRDVSFLVRAQRAEQLRATGLEIISPHGNLTLAPTLVTAGEIAGPYDAVLLTVKGFALEAALDDLAPAIGPETMILPVLNGMRHMETLAERFGRQAVAGCVCKIASHLDDQGRILHLTPLQELAYGELGGEPSARMARLDAVLQGAGFDARLSPAIEQEMWEKWVMLAALGGVTCLMRGNVGEVVATAGGTEFALGFLAEVSAIATAAGHPPGPAFLEQTRALLTQPGSPVASSMYRDLQKGRAVEADQILGDLLARGWRLGVATPLVAAAFSHLTVYQNRLGQSQRGR